MCATPASDRVLSTAASLFYKHGIRAVGVDTVVADSGVAKMTLYKHFPSKDALIVAAIGQQAARWQAWFEEAVLASAEDPLDRLEAMFDVLEVWLGDPGFLGCPVLNAAIELRDPLHPGRTIVREHLGWLRRFVLDLVGEADLVDPECTADALCLLVEGAVVSAQTGLPGAASTGKCIATVLIDARRAPARPGETSGPKHNRSHRQKDETSRQQTP